MPLAVVANLATRWHHFYWWKIWPQSGATCISSKFGYKVAPLASVQNWPPGGATCISCKIGYKQGGATFIGWKFGHKVASLALAPNLATRWRHLHQLKIWSPGGTNCISSKFGYQAVPLELVWNLTTNLQSHTNKFFISYIHYHISLLVNFHVGHLIEHLVNLHDQHHNLSNITSISIINYQSLPVKSSVGIFTHQGHISQLGS